MLLHWFPGDVDATLVFPCNDHTHTFPYNDSLANTDCRPYADLPHCDPPFDVDIYADSYCYIFHTTHGDTYAILSTHPNGHSHPNRKYHRDTLAIPNKFPHPANADAQCECYPAAFIDAKQYPGNTHNTIINPITSKL